MSVNNNSNQNKDDIQELEEQDRVVMKDVKITTPGAMQISEKGIDGRC